MRPFWCSKSLSLLAGISLFLLVASCTEKKSSKEASATEKASSQSSPKEGPTEALQGLSPTKSSSEAAPSAEAKTPPLEDSQGTAEEKVGALDQARASGSPTSPLLESAMKLRKARRFEEALSEMQATLASNPPPPPASSAEILFAIGETHFLKGQNAKEGKLSGVEPEPCYREALKIFQDLILRYPKEEKTAEAAYLLGSSYLLLEDDTKALEAYQRAFDDYPLSPGRSRALLRVGICQESLDNPDKARQTFARILKEFPDKKAESNKAGKYLREMKVLGQRAPELQTSEWLMGQVGKEGIKTFEGEVVVLVFFATWCENCSEEMPHLRSLIKKWSPQGVTFLGVANPDDPKNTLPVDVYVQKNSIEFLDVALDRTMASWAPYQVSGLPAGVLIDRKGIIRWRAHPAFFPRPLVEKVLAEK